MNDSDELLKDIKLLSELLKKYGHNFSKEENHRFKNLIQKLILFRDRSKYQ